MTTPAETAQRAREGSACYCCGAPHPEADLVRLSCHSEVGLCRHCLGWLNRRMRAKTIQAHASRAERYIHIGRSQGRALLRYLKQRFSR